MSKVYCDFCGYHVDIEPEKASLLQELTEVLSPIGKTKIRCKECRKEMQP